MKGVKPMYDEREKVNIERRITTLEVVIGELKSDIDGLSHKLDEIKNYFEGDYLDKRIEDKFLQLTGKFFWKFILTIVGTSGFVSLMAQVIAETIRR